MLKSRTLFDKLNDPRTNEPLNLTQNTELLAESILFHLRRMLNTRQGGPMIQPQDYGMVDITEISNRFPDSIKDVLKTISTNIRTTIEKYEPRLKNVQVEHIGEGIDLQTLKFKITAQLADKKSRDSLSFETVIDPKGEVQLNG